MKTNKKFLGFTAIVAVIAAGLSMTGCASISLSEVLTGKKTTLEVIEGGVREILIGKPFSTDVPGVRDQNEYQAAFEQMFPEVKVTSWSSDTYVNMNFTFQGKGYAFSTIVKGKTASGEYILGDITGYAKSSETGPQQLYDGARKILSNNNNAMDASVFQAEFERQFPEARFPLIRTTSFSSDGTNSSGVSFSYIDMNVTYQDCIWKICFRTRQDRAGADWKLDEYIGFWNLQGNLLRAPVPEKVNRW